MSKGDEVTRTGIGNQGWSRIKLSNGTTAYVSSSYLTKTKPAEDKPKTEEPKKIQLQTKKLIIQHLKEITKQK